MPPEIKVQSPAAPFTAAPASIKGLPPRRDVPGKTRLVKDIVRTGRWMIDIDANGKPVYMDFTPAILQQLASRFAEHKRAGIPHPVCFDHGGGGRVADTPERDSISDIDEVWSDGQTLWLTTYVTPAQKATLTDKVRRVSLGAIPDWRDGTGKLWPGYSLIHVACVAHATVSPQFPFLEMGLKRQAGKQSKPMASQITAADKLAARRLMAGLQGRALPAGPKKSLAMGSQLQATKNGGQTQPSESNTGDIDYEELLKELGRLLALFDVDVPQGLTAENLVGWLSTIADNIESPPGSETPSSVTDLAMSARRSITSRKRPSEPTLADKIAARRALGLLPRK